MVSKSFSPFSTMINRRENMTFISPADFLPITSHKNMNFGDFHITESLSRQNFFSLLPLQSFFIRKNLIWVFIPCKGNFSSTTAAGFLQLSPKDFEKKNMKIVSLFFSIHLSSREKNCLQIYLAYLGLGCRWMLENRNLLFHNRLQMERAAMRCDFILEFWEFFLWKICRKGCIVWILNYRGLCLGFKTICEWNAGFDEVVEKWEKFWLDRAEK